MSRISIALLALLASSGADAATVYKCHTAHGLSYQDRPCHGRDATKNVVDVSDPTIVKNPRTGRLAEWAEQAGQENHQRELQAHAARLQRENQADQAEFAAMVEETERQKDAAAQGSADVPPIYDLQLRQRQAQQQYANRVERRNAELQDVQAELDQYQQR